MYIYRIHWKFGQEHLICDMKWGAHTSGTVWPFVFTFRLPVFRFLCSDESFPKHMQFNFLIFCWKLIRPISSFRLVTQLVCSCLIHPWQFYYQYLSCCYGIVGGKTHKSLPVVDLCAQNVVWHWFRTKLKCAGFRKPFSSQPTRIDFKNIIKELT
jgi:hypothetical protein